MSEQVAEAVEQSSSGSDSNGLALDLAMEAARNDPSLHAEVAAFLADQRQMLADQRHHLHEQLKQLHLGIFEKWLGVLLRLATLIVGLAAAIGVGLMVWDAAHSNGVQIEPFNVPPDLAAKGLSGEVVASQVLDRVTLIETTTQSFRSPRSYANNWGKDIKVEIPETGVSIGEFRRFLREWLGNDIHISGEVWHTDTGIAISARTGGERGETYTGPQSDLDALVQKAAEHVYSQTQPYRYANYVRNRRGYEEARAMYLKLTESSSAEERGWAWQGISSLPLPPSTSGSLNRNAIWALHRALAEYPDYTLAYASLATAEKGLGHDEAVLDAARNADRLLARSSIPDVDPAFLAIARASWSEQTPMALGDYSAVAAGARASLHLPDQAGQRFVLYNFLSLAMAGQHDAAAAQDAFRVMPNNRRAPVTEGRVAVTRLQLQAMRQNWPGVLALAPQTRKIIVDLTREPHAGNPFDRDDELNVQVYPWVALAKARTGDVAGAQALIATTPEDCYACTYIRGLIAAEAGQPGLADDWFAKAIAQAPSIPFANHAWGRTMLARGQPDAAIAQFQLSNQKNPHFADPLEGWGEALMAKNQSHLALAKFVEAEKYAPNWGRLHLKWGEALAFSGKKEEAQKHFARAASLDLTPTEKQELARHP